MQDIAGKLLGMFMKKELLYEPLQESKANYEAFFSKGGQKSSESDLARFKSQYNIICQILDQLNTQPDQKSKLMDLFERLQDYGQPPAGISSVSLPGAM